LELSGDDGGKKVAETDFLQARKILLRAVSVSAAE
jgi:hypothetical protein